MIQLVEAEELGELWIKFEEVKVRTLRHTKQIMELQRKVKKLEGGNKNE